MEKYDAKDGVWRTVGGRRIFIKNGQDLASAMKESGKFKSNNGKKRKALGRGLNDLGKEKMNGEGIKKLFENEKMENEKQSENKENEKINERDAQDLIDELNNEGSDFTFGDAKIEDGKLKTNVGVFMPDERGYVERELEVPLDDVKSYADLEEKMRDWEDRHRDVNSWENEEDFPSQTNGKFQVSEPNAKRYEELAERNRELYKEYAGFADTGDKEKNDIVNKAHQEWLGNKDKMQEIKEKERKNNEEDYKLYKQAKENPDSIDPMTENSTDWEKLDKRFKERYEKEQNVGKSEYEKYKKMRLEDPSEYTNEEIAKFNELDEKYSEQFGNEPTKVVRYRDGYAVIQNGGIQKTFENLDDAKKFENGLKEKNGSGSTNWQKQIKANNEKLNKETNELQQKINDLRNKSYQSNNSFEKYQYWKEAEKLQDEYYEKFRANERANAKLKQENPNEKYLNVEAYATYKDKFNETWGKDGSGDKVVSAKMYTNDEFMEHLEDANWHGERKQLLEANLTNKELEYIKNRTNVSAWGVENLTGKEQVDKLIDEAKKQNNQITNSLRQKAYNKYLREHPNSKLSFEDFLKKN